jgi:hypothetical protein
MEWQQLINIGASTLLMALGWWCRQIWDSVQSLKKDVQKIEVDLPTHYVRKVDIEQRFDRLENILDKIFDKLDNKADK